MNAHPITQACRALLVAHLVATVLDNLPDGKTSLGISVPLVGRLPQWRFFAPNPGVEDLHIMYRTRSETAADWQAWAELPTAIELTPWAFIWNPRSRRPKALFDIINQFRVMSSYPWAFPMAVRSPGFHLIQSEVARHCRSTHSEATEVQFMVVVTTPGKGRDGIKPILVSPAATLATTPPEAAHA